MAERRLGSDGNTYNFNISPPQTEGSDPTQAPKAKETDPNIFGSAAKFLKGLRSKGLPNFNPTKQISSAAFGGSPESKDWRVKLSIPQETNFQNSSLLQPLITTGGLVFPYTPTMIISHSADYNALAPVHNNYPFYAYQNSQVDQLVITGTFINQNALEAQYWVAALHYLRSVTKMFYGESQNSGNPPPVVRLNGYGDYVFNNTPVVITNFTVDMPQEVDYIATQLAIQSAEPTTQIKNGAISYAPVESQITVSCQPVYSRSEVQQFNLDSFVNGSYVLDGKGYI